MSANHLVNFHPHVHVLAADGVFRADGTFVPLPPIPEALLEDGFRRAVLDFLVEERAITEELRSRMLGWRYSGFSVHNQVSVAAEDAEGRKKLAGTMLRAPLSLAKMSYDTASGTVIYRSKMHLGLKRNFQVMPGAEWLELLCKHIPDRYEHLVRYCGWYSSRSRGARAAKVAAPATISSAALKAARAVAPERGFACLNGTNAGRMRHNADCARPNCPEIRPRQARSRTSQRAASSFRAPRRPRARGGRMKFPSMRILRVSSLRRRVKPRMRHSSNEILPALACSRLS